MAGTVKWFKPDKGFGFITADDSAKDVFVHKSVLRRSGLNVLEAGQRVQMRVQDVEKGRECHLGDAALRMNCYPLHYGCHCEPREAFAGPVTGAKGKLRALDCFVAELRAMTAVS